MVRSVYNVPSCSCEYIHSFNVLNCVVLLQSICNKVMAAVNFYCYGFFCVMVVNHEIKSLLSATIYLVMKSYFVAVRLFLNELFKIVMNVSFKVNVPFAPISGSGEDAQATSSVANAVGSSADGDTKTRPSKQVTAEGIADWGSSRLTLKGSYGDGTASLNSGFALRNLGITLTNDPAEKPTVCVTDEEAAKRLQQKGVSDAKEIVGGRHRGPFPPER